MPTPRRSFPRLLRLSAVASALLLVQVCAWAQAPNAAPDAEAVKRLATDDAQVQASRWGVLAMMAGKPWVALTPGDIATVWRMATWVVPGASMRFQRGFCAAAACQASDYVIQYNDKTRQLEFFEDGAMAYTGHVEAEGALRLKGTGLVGVLTAETLRHDAATGTVYANAHELKPGTPQQLTSATRGFPKAVAALSQAPAPAPVAAASAPSSDADLRAELAAMKARMEQMSRQLEQAAAAPPPARALTPAEARAKAAEEKRIAAAKAREEAQRQAEERRAKAEEEKRQQAEARAREAQAKAAEAARLAEERRAQQEAARREAEERRAQQEAARREAEAAKLREAEAAKARAAQAAAAARTPATPAPSAAPPVARVPEGPVRPGLYSTGTGYDVQVKVVGDSLELNEVAYGRISNYRPIAPGSRVYGYRNPNTGTHFALTVVDNTTLMASRFDSSGQVLPNGTPLKLAGGGQPQPVGEENFKGLERVAQKYLQMAQTDPSNAQAWSFCGMAAMARAHGQNDVQVRQAAMALKSIATTGRTPCEDAIPHRIWDDLK